MKNKCLALVLGLAACQSVEDVPGGDTLASPSSSLPVSAAFFENLSHLASTCEATVSRTYEQRALVLPVQQREFSIALGQASQACEKMRDTLKALNAIGEDTQAFEKNIHFAQSLLGPSQGQELMGSDSQFPDATDSF